MNCTRVMHVVDALRVGGAERVAVNLANLLPQTGYKTYLCTTREEGPFAALVLPHVERLSLQRRGTSDVGALRKLIAFNRIHSIQILHAHGSALFFARLASLFKPYPAVIWHDHYGRYAYNDRSAWLYHIATHRIGGVIAVNRPLLEWSRNVLAVPRDRTWYIPNLVSIADTRTEPICLPGTRGSRIICLANIRPQKDHPTLLQAMKILVSKLPETHLLLVGDFAEPDYKDAVLRQISELGLDRNVSYLGRREDVAAILRCSDVAVLSSRSEGLPIALLEYGMASLASVVTDVGECAEVLDHGAAGVLVPPGSSQALADAIFSLLTSPSRRYMLGNRLHQRIQLLYSAERIVTQICDVYQQVITGRYQVSDGELAGMKVRRAS